jgi:hypothetical protein
VIGCAACPPARTAEEPAIASAGLDAKSEPSASLQVPEADSASDVDANVDAEIKQASACAAPWADFLESAPGECTRTEQLPEGRRYTNLPASLDKNAETEVIVFTTPNGNTLEQTLGRARHAEESFRYDIQHILAQTRLLRREASGPPLVLVVLEAPDLSWPTWLRAGRRHVERVPDLLAESTAPFNLTRLSLASHSGGGSFFFGLLDAGRTLPTQLERIILLDSNYDFHQAMGHGDKLARWLRGSSNRRLVVVTYDDRRVRLHGRLVVSKEGGSHRATLRMVKAFREKGIRLAEDRLGSYQRFRGLDDRIDLRSHVNPDNKILHSALVSDENGLLYAWSLGREGKTPIKLGGQRRFTAFVDPAPPMPLIISDAGPQADADAN